MIARQKADCLTHAVSLRRERNRTAQRLASECHRVRCSSEFRVGIGKSPSLPFFRRAGRPAGAVVLLSRVSALASVSLIPDEHAERVCGRRINYV